jgi:hypothetical protein
MMVRNPGLMPKHKFHAKQTVNDGYIFSSKKESKYYSELKSRQAAGEVLFFLRQVPFHLGGGIKYVCDFQVFKTDGTVEFVDVKGFVTPMYKLKKAQVEASYPIEITEV